MTLIDGCPRCVATYSAPTRTEPTENGRAIRARYRCPACLYSWLTEWAVA